MIQEHLEYILPKFRFIRPCGSSRKSRRKFLRKIFLVLIGIQNYME